MLPSARSSLVLLAEVDPWLRRLLTRSLTRGGFRVVDTGDGAELNEWIRRLITSDRDHQSVALIVADQRMPIATGLEVLEALRRVDRSTPFVLLATLHDVSAHTEAARLGASCVLDKPFDFDTLRAVARRYALPSRID